MKSWSLLGVLDVEDEPIAANGAGVADLAAGFAVEGRPVEHQRDRRARRWPSAESASWPCSRMPMTFAESARWSWRSRGTRCRRGSASLSVSSGPVAKTSAASLLPREMAACCFSSASKPCHVDAQVVVGGQALGDLDGDAVGRVQVERVAAGDRRRSRPHWSCGRCRCSSRMPFSRLRRNCSSSSRMTVVWIRGTLSCSSG